MIVLPMAGFSRRFSEAGYDRPKYELPLAGRPVLDWTLLSFRRHFGEQTMLLVARDLPGLQAFVEERLQACAVPDAKVILLAQPTQGQAETVAVGLERSGAADDEPVTIFNIDTLRPDLRLRQSADEAGYLETFVGSGDHWSFVEPTEPGSDRAIRVAEKIRISDHCCTGLYHFASAQLYERAYRRECAERTSHELFVAPLYQHLIEEGVDIRFTTIVPSEVFFSGTPAEYVDLLGREDQVRRAFALGADG